jgi:hypothetical protein
MREKMVPPFVAASRLFSPNLEDSTYLPGCENALRVSPFVGLARTVKVFILCI